MNTTKNENSGRDTRHSSRSSGSDLPFGTVVFEPRLRNPRSMVIEGRTVITEGLGVGGLDRVMTREQWLAWTEGFRDELTGREFRECREAVERGFKEPPEWQDFRDRYETTGCPWLD